MNLRRRFAVAASALMFLLTACDKDDEPEIVLPRAYSIKADVKDITFQKGKSIDIEFTIADQSAQINYDVSSPDCQIGLRYTDDTSASPQKFGITAIVKNNLTCTYTATITDYAGKKAYEKRVMLALMLDDGGMAFSDPFTVIGKRDTLPTRTINTGLPVMYINTSDHQAITSKTEFKDALISIDGLGEFEDLISDSCQVRGRGNTTWSWPKKPYLIKMNHRREMLGMPEHKRWVLMSNFMDRTLMRNVLALEVSNQTSLAWTPRAKMVELVLNGKHQGCYLLIEQIRVDENRLNISPTDGFILESDFHWDNEIQWLLHYGHSGVWPDAMPFGLKYPEPDSVTNSQLGKIKTYVLKTMRTLFGDDYKDPETGWRAWMDEQSFIDYWIIYELMGNHELANPGSIYTYRDADGLLMAGPVWDFDWGTLSYDANPAIKNSIVHQGKSYMWYYRLLEDEEFCKNLVKRWKELKPKFEALDSFITEQKEYMKKSAALNFKMWNPAEDGIINGDETLSYSAAVDRLHEIYLDRIKVMDRELSKW